MAVRAVILDIDGTLIDSNDAHAQAWVDVGREAGIPIAFAYVRSLIGMGSDRVVPQLAGVDRESEEGKRLADRHGEIFRAEYLPRLRAFQGARGLLERLKAEDVVRVVATSAGKTDMKALLERAGVADLIEGRTSSGDVDESKPAPDVVEAALQEAGVDPAEAVMLGDTPYDVEACRRAGVRCIALRCGGWWTDEQLGGAHLILDGPAAVLARWDEIATG